MNKLIGSLATVALIGSPLSSRAEDALKTDTKVIATFETEADVADVTLNNTSKTLVPSGQGQDGQALRLKFDPAAYPSIFFNQSTPSDFRGYGGLAFDVYNPSENTVAFAVRIDSSLEADGNGNHSRSGKGSIDGHQRATFVQPFGVDPAALGMKGLPGFGEYRSLGSSGSGPFDLGHIVRWQIFMNRPASSEELVIDNVRLIPGKKHDFTKIIDQYGQYTREDWPGKVKSDTDFARQLTEEDADLKAHPAPTEFDKYGGWAKGPQLKATGFFRVEKYQGKWAFVDPEGRLFLSFGPTTIGNSAKTALPGREYMFGTLPNADPVLAKFSDDKSIDFLSANLQRKYGDDFKKAWYDHTYDRLRSWGFNTIGAFSSWDTLNNKKVPYTVTVWPTGKHARITTGKEQVRAMHDPFDPQFALDVAGAVKAQASQVKDDPYCIGYFVGNEEHWGHYRAGDAAHYTLITGALKSKAADSPAKRAFLSQLEAKYGDIAKLNTAWSTSYADWAALAAPLTIKTPFSDGMRADFSDLLKSYADEYFRIVQQEIKKADPNHLYLGCRFAGYSPEVLQAAAKYSDVLSFNIYRLKIDPKEWAVLDPYDMPVVIGEFHFGAVDRGVFDVGLIGVADQAGRARAYQQYLQSVLEHPKFIGAHWFQYTDQPTTGRPMDGENGNVGFVSITDTPYPELIKAARETHAKMYSTRFAP